jgi:hypothetical protein
MEGEMRRSSLIFVSHGANGRAGVRMLCDANAGANANTNAASRHVG